MPKQTNPPASAYIKRKQAISAIWLAPIVALIFGGWLLVNAYLKQGTFITVQFDNARGIVIGKTEVRYKGLTTGVVKDIEVADDLQSVIVTIEMVASASKMLTDNTEFWYVTADISLQGITGLDTLLSGGYINMQPNVNDKGKAQRHFIASQEPPVVDQTTPGLHLTLLAKTLGSISKNSPVTFKQITVGHVSGFHYLNNKQQVEIGIFIKPEYGHLVTKNSRFWNASGFDVTASLTSGLKVHSKSLAAIISGGIAFYSPAANEQKVAENGEQFILHPDFQAAEMAMEISLTLPWDSGINPNTQIRFQGVAIGKISEIKPVKNNNKVLAAKAYINPKFSPYLTSETQFYRVVPALAEASADNLHTLLVGSYISFQPSANGEPTTSFVVYQQKPPYPYSTPGLHLVLTASGSLTLSPGSAVYFQQQKVGTVQAIERQNAEQSLIHIHIQEQYQSLVTADSRFWQTGKISISAGLQGVDVKAAPLPAIINGGIAFDHGDSKQQLNNGATFFLAQNKLQAEQSLHFTLYSNDPLTAPVNTRLIYQGKPIGRIHQHKQQQGKIALIAGIYPQYQDILRENTHFWLVTPTLSLAGVASPQTLLSGNYIRVSAGGGEVKHQFNLAPNPIAKDTSAAGLQLQLSAKHSYGMFPGSQVIYKGLPVGEVDTIELAQSGQQVLINLTIAPQHQQLVNQYTRFYNSSGITVKGNLGQFSLQTDSLDSVIKGGISFFTPELSEQQLAIEEGRRFSLFADLASAKLAGTAVNIHFNNADGLYLHQPIKFQGHTVGKVEHLSLDPQGQGATVFAYLSDSHGFATQGAKFWLESPSLNLLNSAKFNKLIAGDFINVLPGDGKAVTEFTAEDFPPAISALAYGLNLTLVAKQLGSIRVGNPVMYRQVTVGRVIGVDLSDHADKVNIYINIAKRYAPLVSTASKFWNVSGFAIEAGIFSGLEISSDSIESILSGGIAFATPIENESSQESALASTTFTLHTKAQKEWLGWTPKINLN